MYDSSTPATDSGNAATAQHPKGLLLYPTYCVHCDYLTACLYLQRAPVPVSLCELKGIPPDADHPFVTVPPSFKSHTHLGLCSNCESLPDCRYPNTPGGVWHCEEYK